MYIFKKMCTVAIKNALAIRPIWMRRIVPHVADRIAMSLSLAVTNNKMMSEICSPTCILIPED